MSGESFPRLDPPADCCFGKYPEFMEARKIECPLGMSSKVGMIFAFKVGAGPITPKIVWGHTNSVEGKPKGFLYHNSTHDCYCIIEACYQEEIDEVDTPSFS